MIDLERITNNYSIITTDNKVFYFSYNTCIAFDTFETGLVVTENEWGSTTGRHLNYISRDKSIRIPYEEFKRRLNEVI